MGVLGVCYSITLYNSVSSKFKREWRKVLHLACWQKCKSNLIQTGVKADEAEIVWNLVGVCFPPVIRTNNGELLLFILLQFWQRRHQVQERRRPTMVAQFSAIICNATFASGLHKIGQTLIFKHSLKYFCHYVPFCQTLPLWILTTLGPLHHFLFSSLTHLKDIKTNSAIFVVSSENN